MIKLQGVYVFQFALLVTAAKWIFFLRKQNSKVLLHFLAEFGSIWQKKNEPEWANENRPDL